MTDYALRNGCSERIKLARSTQQPYLTQGELAAKCQLMGWDISCSGITKIENKNRCLYAGELKILSQLLNKSADWLLGLESEE